MADTFKLRQRRESLWKENPDCHYCGQKTELPPYEAELGNKIKSYTATLEHVKSRNHPLRSFGNVYRLSCFDCNNKKSYYDQHIPERAEELLNQELQTGYKLTIKEIRNMTLRADEPWKNILNNLQV